MKSKIVADGDLRLRRDEKFKARLQAVHDSVRARHELELAEAGFFARLILRWRFAAEIRKERQKIEPSPYSLFSSQAASRISH
ncbi:MAG TPA: hypothetical protein VNZ25_02830 [Candidatus Angelobacter sp.]|nr:hypothetical protein [Candidatus Angelobacter sp.]